MIACPACTARYDLPPNRLAAGNSLLRCAACGHGWIEAHSSRMIDVSPRVVTVAAGLPRVADDEVARLIGAAREAEAAFALARAARARRQRGWVMLAAAVLAPFIAALIEPEAVVAAAPAAVRLYQAIGMKVNIYGLELRKVERQHMIVEGARILAIKGEIVNISDEDRKVPSLRLTLKDAGHGEVYAWTIDSGVRPLRPGEATSFTTRVASAPEAAREVEIRFARLAEIGSNAPP